MTLIEWTPALEIGLEEIDADHRGLVDQLNAFYGAATGGRLAEARDALDGFFSHASRHFMAEEALMSDLPPDERARHVKEHMHLTDELADRVAAVHAGSMRYEDIGRFVRDWLLLHIALTDRSLAQAVSRAAARRMTRTAGVRG